MIIKRKIIFTIEIETYVEGLKTFCHKKNLKH